MRRMLAEVIESERLPEQRCSDGLDWNNVRCLVKILGPVPEAHGLPADVKGSTLTITRPTLSDREYQPGSKVILTPEECEPLVRRPADIPQVGNLRGRAITYRTDINADGFTERVMENSFLRVVIGPRYGARIWEIWHKRRGINVLYQTYHYDERYIDLGGQDDRIREQDGASEFYNSEFAEKEVKTDDQGCRAVYEFKCEKTKGVTLVKEILLPADAPLVYYRCTFKYAGAEKPPEDGKPDEQEISYWTRLGLATNAEIDRDFVALIPTRARLLQRRPSIGWWEPQMYNVSAPYHLGVNEKEGIATGLIFDHTQCRVGMIYHSKFYTTLEPQMSMMKAPKDGECSVAHAIVVGDTFSADQQGLAMVTQGPGENGESPVFVLSTNCEPGGGKLSCGKREIDVQLAEAPYADLPKLCTGVHWTSASQARFTSLSRDGHTWKFGGKP